MLEEAEEKGRGEEEGRKEDEIYFSSSIVFYMVCFSAFYSRR